MSASHTHSALPGATAVILSGGSSSRMGTPKALLRIGDFSFLEHILSVYAARPVPSVLVLSELNAAAILGATALHPDATVSVRINPDPNGDRVSSLLRGLEAVPEGDFVFIQDVDRPQVTPELLDALFESRPERGFVAPEWIPGRAGHPLLLSPSLVAALLGGPRAATLRETLTGVPRRLVPAGSANDLNINTPEEYRRFIDRSSP